MVSAAVLLYICMSEKIPTTDKGRKLLKIRKVIVIIGWSPVVFILLMIAVSLFVWLTKIKVPSGLEEVLNGLSILSAFYALPLILITMFLVSVIDRFYYKAEGDNVSLGEEKKDR